MPDDIVKRLRALDGTYDIATILDRAREAANEIMRLRTRVASLKGQIEEEEDA